MISKPALHPIIFTTMIIEELYEFLILLNFPSIVRNLHWNPGWYAFSV